MEGIASKIGSWFFIALIAAVVISFMTISDYRKGSALRTDGVETAGRVSDIKESRGRRGRISYIPVVSFADQQGNACSLQTESSRNNQYSVGQEVRIVYLPEKPTVGAMVGSRLLKEGGDTVWFAIMGGLWVATVICGVCFFLGKKQDDVNVVAT